MKQYEITCPDIHSIRISRMGHGQTLRHEDLCRNGVNSIRAAMAMIEAKHEGRVK